MATEKVAFLLPEEKKMADQIVTVKKLQDADKDCDSLDRAVNGDDDELVKTRRGITYPTMPNAIRQIMENGGFMPFATEVELLAYVPNITPSAAKAMDTKKVWLWKDDVWIDTGKSELDQANENIIKSAEASMQVSSDLYDPDNPIGFEIKNGDTSVLVVIGDKTIGDFYDRDGNPVGASDIEAAEVKYDLYAPNQLKTELKDGDEVLAQFPIELPDPEPQPQPDPKIESKSYFYNAGSSIKYINDFGEYEVKTGHAIDAFIPHSELATLAVSVNGWMHGGKSLNILGVNGCLYPNPLKILAIVLSNGQSLNVGSQGVPGISFINPQPDYALMMKSIGIALGVSGNQGKVPLADFSNVTDFESIRVKVNSSDASDYDAKEILCIPFAQKVSNVLAQENGVPLRVLSFAAGVGGTALDNADHPSMDQEALGLKKGSNAYQNLMNAISKAKEIANKKGWVVVVPAMLWQHGEADASNPKLGLRLNTYVSDVNTDVKAITGQTQNVVFYTSLKSNHYTNGTIGLEQSLEVARTNPLFKVIGTNYPAEPAIWANDYTHLSARGYNYLGYMYAKAFYQELKNGFGTFKALTFKSAVKNGKTIDVKFNVPVAPIQYKTTDVVLAQDGWGFRFTDNDVPVQIFTVEITADDSIRITLATDPSSTAQVLSGAMFGHNSSDLSLRTRPRSNICDSDVNFGNSAAGDSTQNWLIPFKHQF